MSDGPFKNLRLTQHWKKFAKAAYNDAFDQMECRGLASHAIVQDVLTDPVRVLLKVLKTYMDQNQMEMAPQASLERFFNDYGKNQFADILKKEMAWRLHENDNHKKVLEQAVASSVDAQIDISRTRMQEECIRSCESGEMNRNQLEATIDRTNTVLGSLDRQNICEVILACDKQAFKDAVAKKEGIDEGPSL